MGAVAGEIQGAELGSLRLPVPRAFGSALAPKRRRLGAPRQYILN